MRRAGCSGDVLAVLGACLLAWLAASQIAHAKPQRDGFYFGMPLAEANRLLENTADYEVAYRVDTASTCDIFVRFQQHTLYLGHFLNGECCSVEKRAIVTAEAVDGMFASYESVLGAPGKGADSQDNRAHYAKWAWKDRELELSASARSDGSYLLAHEEYDPQRVREAVLLQQRELREMPQAIDPLTGQPLALRQQQALQAATANASSPGDPVWEEAQPEIEGGAAAEDADTDPQADAAEDKQQDPPDITGKNDWQ